MVARYFRAQIMVLVCGGLVGPIFLFAYFVLPGMIGSFGTDMGSAVRQNTAWMLWVGLLITVADGLVAVWLAVVRRAAEQGSTAARGRRSSPTSDRAARLEHVSVSLLA